MLDKLSGSGFNYHCTDHFSLSPPLHHIFMLSQLDCQWCVAFFFSVDKLQTCPCTAPAFFHCDRFLTSREPVVSLIFSEIRLVTHGPHPPHTVCTCICKMMQCGSHLARVTAAENCPVTVGARRWPTASYEYANMKIQEETVNKVSRKPARKMN